MTMKTINVSNAIYKRFTSFQQIIEERLRAENPGERIIVSQDLALETALSNIDYKNFNIVRKVE